jgi:hypothetical protein
MRFVLIIALSATTGIAFVIAGNADELFTVQNAVLCTDPANLRAANEPAIAKSSIVLRVLGCVRIKAGIPTRLIERPYFDGPWRVRLYSEGRNSGVILWGLSSAFTGSTLLPTRRAGP